MRKFLEIFTECMLFTSFILITLLHNAVRKFRTFLRHPVFMHLLNQADDGVCLSQRAITRLHIHVCDGRSICSPVLIFIKITVNSTVPTVVLLCIVILTESIAIHHSLPSLLRVAKSRRTFNGAMQEKTSKHLSSSISVLSQEISVAQLNKNKWKPNGRGGNNFIHVSSIFQFLLSLLEC